MAKEKMLRAKIRELQRHRNNGISKMESAEYEVARDKRGEAKGEQGGGGGGGGGVAAAGGRQGGWPGGREDGRDGEFAAIEPAGLRAPVGPREGAVQLAEPEPRYVTVKTIFIKDHLQSACRASPPWPPAQLPGQSPQKRILNSHRERVDIQGAS